MNLSETSLGARQQDAVTRLYNYDETILVMATGDGKTVICLTAIKELIDEGVVGRVIVACPARVVKHWATEQAKWDHLAGLDVVPLIGTTKQRSAVMETRRSAAHVWVISLNSLDWLLETDHGADGVIIDELSKAAGKQAKGLRTKRLGGCFNWRVGMTATPVSQDFLKLYSMCRIIDRGAALGTNKRAYEEAYFDSDYMGYTLTLRAHADKIILSRIKGLVFAVEDKKADVLPPLKKHERRFDMPTGSRGTYDQMKKDMVVEDESIEAANAAVQSGKLRQIASGFIYNEDGVARHLDTARLTEAMRWVRDLDGASGVIFFEFIEQGAELNKAMPETSTFQIDVFIHVGGKGKILLAQAQSLSHGVDGLQYVCSNVLFYQPVWSRDTTEQAVGRVWRTGQDSEVNVTTLVCDDTLDDVVVARVEGRGEWMKIFMRHLQSGAAA